MRLGKTELEVSQFEMRVSHFRDLHRSVVRITMRGFQEKENYFNHSFGAKILAMSGVEMLVRSDLRSEIRSEFEKSLK